MLGIDDEARAGGAGTSGTAQDYPQYYHDLCSQMSHLRDDQKLLRGEMASYFDEQRRREEERLAREQERWAEQQSFMTWAQQQGRFPPPPSSPPAGPNGTPPYSYD